MFRFSIRDLFWLILVAAVGLGWAIYAQRSQASLEQAQERLATWRAAAGTLEHAIEKDGGTVGWHDLGERGIFLFWTGGRNDHLIPLDASHESKLPIH